MGAYCQELGDGSMRCSNTPFEGATWLEEAAPAEAGHEIRFPESVAAQMLSDADYAQARDTMIASLMRGHNFANMNPDQGPTHNAPQTGSNMRGVIEGALPGESALDAVFRQARIGAAALTAPPTEYRGERSQTFEESPYAESEQPAPTQRFSAAPDASYSHPFADGNLARLIRIGTSKPEPIDTATIARMIGMNTGQGIEGDGGYKPALREGIGSHLSPLIAVDDRQTAPPQDYPSPGSVAGPDDEYCTCTFSCGLPLDKSPRQEDEAVWNDAVYGDTNALPGQWVPCVIRTHGKMRRNVNVYASAQDSDLTPPLSPPVYFQNPDGGANDYFSSNGRCGKEFRFSVRARSAIGSVVITATMDHQLCGKIRLRILSEAQTAHQTVPPPKPVPPRPLPKVPATRDCTCTLQCFRPWWMGIEPVPLGWEFKKCTLAEGDVAHLKFTLNSSESWPTAPFKITCSDPAGISLVDKGWDRRPDGDDELLPQISGVCPCPYEFHFQLVAKRASEEEYTVTATWGALTCIVKIKVIPTDCGCAISCFSLDSAGGPNPIKQSSLTDCSIDVDTTDSSKGTKNFVFTHLLGLLELTGVTDKDRNSWTLDCETGYIEFTRDIVIDVGAGTARPANDAEFTCHDEGYDPCGTKITFMVRPSTKGLEQLAKTAGRGFIADKVIGTVGAQRCPFTVTSVGHCDQKLLAKYINDTREPADVTFEEAEGYPGEPLGEVRQSFRTRPGDQSFSKVSDGELIIYERGDDPFSRYLIEVRFTVELTLDYRWSPPDWSAPRKLVQVI